MIKSTSPEEVHDVIIIGGGPAGAAVATFLSRKGHDCLVVEKASFPRYHVGESLIPHTYGTLDRLGLLDKLKESTYPVKHSVRFVSESGKHSDPFYFDETLPGESARTWQVERSSFDQLCLQNAKDAGVTVMEESRIASVLMEGNTAIGVALQHADSSLQHIHAKVIVDASGRACVIGNQLNLKEPVAGLNKASIWAYYKGGDRLEGRDAGETTIFKTRNQSWFWHIPLPDDMISVGIVGDPDQLLAEKKNFHTILDEEIDACSGLKSRLQNAERVGKVRGYKQLAYINRNMSGDGWIMIGDAAAFLDPIYSSGLYLAMASGELAAESLHAALVKGDHSAKALGAHFPVLLEGVEVIRRLIYAFYDPAFSFGAFAKKNPELRPRLIDCLVGDVVGKDMSAFTAAIEEMSSVPSPLNIS